MIYSSKHKSCLVLLCTSYHSWNCSQPFANNHHTQGVYTSSKTISSGKFKQIPGDVHRHLFITEHSLSSQQVNTCSLIVNLNKLWCKSTTNPIPVLRITASHGFSELTKNVIRSSHGHPAPSLKISCKSVQPFSCNLANKETKKERNKQTNKDTYKQTKKWIENITRPAIYWGAGNLAGVEYHNPVYSISATKNIYSMHCSPEAATT